MPDLLKPYLVPIHREGWPFVTVFAIVTVLLGAVLGAVFFWIGVLLTVWCAFFFRNPDRVTPVRAGLVVSPADGVVQAIRRATPPPELQMPEASLTRISVFMSVFDVHVNRIPVDGRVARLDYRPGRFLNASLDKASQDNERQAILIETADGKRVAVVQIAGLVARRILCELEPEMAVRAGERFGMIRFGSRLDVYLPDGVPALVCEGQRAIAGETVLADLAADPETGGNRIGEKR